MITEKPTLAEASDDGYLALRLHPREFALISLMRRLYSGTLTSLGVKDGVPDTVVLTEQRINFGNQAHLERMFEIEGVFMPLKRG